MGLVATQIYDAAQDRKFQYSLILIHDIILGVIIFLILSTFLLHSSINYYKKITKQMYTLNTTTSSNVSNESSDQENKPLNIKRQGTKVPCKKHKVYLKGVSSGDG